MAISQSQLTKLGERLKKEPLEEADLRMLDEYRRSFGAVSEMLMRVLRDEMGLAPTARSAKSTLAIVDKLRRQSIRLGQIQDIAGCRVIVADMAEQDRVLAEISQRFSGAIVDDKRERPTFAYRALHVIVKHDAYLAEMQIRTQLQHLWASLSEKLADIHGHEIKYGRGPEWPRSALSLLSALVHKHETQELKFFELDRQRALDLRTIADESFNEEWTLYIQDIEENRAILLRYLTEFLSDPQKMNAGKS
ncbi:ppGpp synthetase/RelA/SpoT-type nucleotidyltransferase [Paucibacter oligotrophus]|uniref:PpGpp synthetase/RelA/SpoT-type nucleotidyltransferase n=1 Tax=Roseateles oligotrophus TaxID=1769250 RepID=A0A840LE54_9BURK|nr:RelA/SpoT domain-containing protein [Roseateles oligotrophus]MBB4845255.1 ppGpp synthetase/RelA/SpoT-type nucleotidyltransferase [Roseateles oligotrophus]